MTATAEPHKHRPKLTLSTITPVTGSATKSLTRQVRLVLVFWVVHESVSTYVGLPPLPNPSRAILCRRAFWPNTVEIKIINANDQAKTAEAYLQHIQGTRKPRERPPLVQWDASPCLRVVKHRCWHNNSSIVSWASCLRHHRRNSWVNMIPRPGIGWG